MRVARFRTYVAIVVVGALPGVVAAQTSSTAPPAAIAAPLATSATDPFRDALAESQRLEAAANYRGAIDALGPFGEAPRERYVVRLRRGWLCYLAGDHEASAAHYRGAIEAAPLSIEARVGHLLPLLAAQRFGEAEAAAREALQLDPTNYFANLRLAHALRMQGKHAEAEQVDLALVTRQPNDVASLAELGMTYRAQQRPHEAQAVFEQILTLEPANVLARYELGLAPSPAPEELAPHVATSTQAPTLVVTAVPNVAWIDYGGSSIKRHGIAGGLYASVGRLNLLEASFENTHINFRTGADIDQQDYVLAYNHFAVPNWKFRAGTHWIGSSDSFGNGSWIAFGGAHRLALDRFDFGADYYHSRYADATTSLNVDQVTPQAAFEQYLDPATKMRLETLGYAIFVDRDLGLGRQQFYSVESRWRLDRAGWGIAAFGWAGRQTYAVRRDGFIVFNLAEEHRGGYGLDFILRRGARTQLTLRAVDEIFSDFSTGLETHQVVVAALLSHQW